MKRNNRIIVILAVLIMSTSLALFSQPFSSGGQNVNSFNNDSIWANIEGSIGFYHDLEVRRNDDGSPIDNYNYLYLLISIDTEALKDTEIDKISNIDITVSAGDDLTEDLFNREVIEIDQNLYRIADSIDKYKGHPIFKDYTEVSESFGPDGYKISLDLENAQEVLENLDGRAAFRFPFVLNDELGYLFIKEYAEAPSIKLKYTITANIDYKQHSISSSILSISSSDEIKLDRGGN